MNVKNNLFRGPSEVACVATYSDMDAESPGLWVY